MRLVASVHLSVRPLTTEPFDLQPCIIEPQKLVPELKVRRMWTCGPIYVKYQGVHTALLSAAKSNRSHYQFEVFVCVSVISWRMRIIARMWSIGF